MNQVYQRKQYKVYEGESFNGSYFIVHNSAMDGFTHTHVKTISQAKLLIELSLTQRLPRDLSRYLLISLLRINEDSDYTRKISELLENKRWNKQYINVNKGVKRK